MLSNSSGPFSKKTPKGTNPALFSLPPREPKDNLIDPILTCEQIEAGNLDNLYVSPETDFRNVSYTLDWRTMKDLADHADDHVRNNTFGGGEEGFEKLFLHQELMYEGMLAGMSFLEAHEYALRKGPQPVHQSSHA